jgi:transcriptional regulator with XRE-family HTH domain
MDEGSIRDDLLREFARRLKSLRKDYGRRKAGSFYAAGQFADELGIKGERYRRYERGDVEPPLEVLAAIRRVTGWSLDRLVADMAAGTDDPIKPPKTKTDVTFGQRMRWTRELDEPYIEEAAASLGVTPETLADWENDRAQPPYEKVREFCHRHGVSPQFLYKGWLTGMYEPVKRELLQRHPELKPPRVRHRKQRPAETEE